MRSAYPPRFPTIARALTDLDKLKLENVDWEVVVYDRDYDGTPISRGLATKHRGPGRRKINLCCPFNVLMGWQNHYVGNPSPADVMMWIKARRGAPDSAWTEVYMLITAIDQGCIEPDQNITTKADLLAALGIEP